MEWENIDAFVCLFAFVKRRTGSMSSNADAIECVCLCVCQARACGKQLCNAAAMHFCCRLLSVHVTQLHCCIAIRAIEKRWKVEFRTRRIRVIYFAKENKSDCNATNRAFDDSIDFPKSRLAN